MNAKQLLTAIVIGLAIAITGVGCYTIIRHPSMENAQYDAVAYEHSANDRDCVRCHSDYAKYPYGYYEGYYPEFYWDYPNWGDYYAYPWWWDGYWYKDGVAVDTVDKIARPDRQRGLRPPYVTGAQPVNPTVPIFNSGGTQPPVVGGSTGGTTTGGNTGTTPPTNTDNDDKKEDTKPPKRRGK